VSTAVPQLHFTVLDQDRSSGHPRIAFCHGLFGQGRNWTTIGKAVSDDYAATLIDMPNHGRSAWTDTVDYRIVADQVGDFLRGQGGSDPWALVGHSMGGKIAMMIALRHPELVRRLCVVDIAPVDYRGKSEFATYVRAMRAVDLGALQSRGDAEEQLRELVPDRTVRGFLLQNLRRGGDSGWHWQMNLPLLGDHLDQLSDWPDPESSGYDGATLWVAGAESDYIRPEYAPAMKELFSQVRTVKIKGAGHWVHSQQPEIFTQVLRRFLSS
jgi:esterase